MKEILLGRFRKEDMVDRLNSDPESFCETLDLALDGLETVSWRAAWVLYHSMTEQDVRLQPHVEEIINAIQGKKDGHQRELLRILEKLDIPEELEGLLFDVGMTVWEQTGKIPSVRLFALRNILRIAKKYPAIKSELDFFTDFHYTESLSPGIRNAVERMFKELQK